MIENITSALGLIFGDPMTIVIVLLAGAFGLVVGAIPGLTATLGAALLIPFTFFMDPVPAIASIISMSAMAIFAGDIPGGLLRMPGTPSSAAYVEDAFSLTRKGKGAIALGVSLIASVIGGLVGSVVLIFLAQLLGRFAMNFTSFEYFWVAVLGLTAAVIISRGSQVKGALALVFGLMISTVGLDLTLGQPRFTFGLAELYRGIDFIPAMIGLFGLSEVLRNVTTQSSKVRKMPVVKTKGMLRESLGEIRKHGRFVAQGSVTGSITGALPGAGADIAAWISYGISKATSRNSKLYGKGSTEAIAGASAANNSALASAFIPTLAFGIPGDTITAILIGVLVVKGIEPGPALFTQNTDTLYALYLMFIIANILLLPLGFLLIKGASTILRIPRAILMASIVAVSVMGAYAINNGYLEIIIVLVFGILGVLFERFGLPLAPVVLGIVLGPIVERNFLNSVIKTEWDFTQFFTRPISAVLIVLTVLMLLAPLVNDFVSKRRAQRKEAAQAQRNDQVEIGSDESAS
ncbi:TctA family transporter [Actinobaculum suis]|uniref:TctA family transporter n=1 Tax=Actinobaculum suis TaxID=1657 RepID=A0A0K9EVM2_9ACTO|nr:tripartite tricarboxylate transporter permease [Actinobaculum suis]KMY23912.1 C4-dicarboxylate ABC transporter permease [Actinobaculum suis]MDY5152843.1 tripartite tricarboxylate transporter permease [Actinobaculum suis]OCA93347.1 C4-dicarboxylate ABC transporter permease [Actinobaculum suis]SDE65626.1 TctA family transporter [Actinobaculum suis]